MNPANRLAGETLQPTLENLVRALIHNITRSFQDTMPSFEQNNIIQLSVFSNQDFQIYYNHVLFLLQAPSQWKPGAGKETDPFQPPVTPAGMRTMMVEGGSGTAQAPREAAPPSTLEVGVRLMEEREAT